MVFIIIIIIRKVAIAVLCILKAARRFEPFLAKFVTS